MAKARLVFNGDNSYTRKVSREYKLTPEIEQAIDNIPGVVDDANSVSTTDALSAHMGKVLQDQITDLQWIWTFLSGWDCVTGLPLTNPQEDPYTYKPGNYYIVANVWSWDNFKPHWSVYTRWTASITVETAAVWLNDRYMYDWADWVRIPAGNRSMDVDTALSPSSVRPVENRVVTNALSWKQDTLIAWDGINIAADGKTISAVTNVKAFYISSIGNPTTADMDEAQAAYDWYLAGNTPLMVIWWDKTYVFSSVYQWTMYFYSAFTWYSHMSSWDSVLNNERFTISFSDDTVTGIGGAFQELTRYLATDHNYESGWWSNYTPAYNWSPATKIYVDDKVNNTALAASWSWDTTHAPSKNAVYNALVNVATLMWVSIDDIIAPTPQ